MTPAADLASFLTERLDEAAATARAALECAEVKDGRWYDEEDEITDGNGLRLATVNSPPVTSHIAAHDPARVLRSITATRALIRLAYEHAADLDSNYGCGHDPAEIEAGKCPEHQPDTLPILRHLASEWADHPACPRDQAAEPAEAT